MPPVEFAPQSPSPRPSPADSPPSARPAPPAPPVLTVEDGVVRQAWVPALVPPPHTGSLADIPFDNAREAPDAPVLARKGPDGRWHDVSAAAFAAEVLALAKGLIAVGLNPGDRLAVMSRTTWEWTLFDFAAWAAGLVTVPVYPTASAHQVAWILHDSGAVACLVEDTERARLVSGERGRLPGLLHLWQCDTGAVAQLVAAGAHLPDHVVHERRASLVPAHVATLVHTSGTTGRSKGCVLTHGNFLSEVDNAVELLHPVFRSLTDEPATTLLFLPLAHVFGRMVAIGCLRARVKLGHAPSIAGEDLLADLAGFRPTFLLAIPYVLEKVHNSARATAERAGKAAAFDRAAETARAWGEATLAGRRPGLALRAAHALYEPLVYRRIREALGGRVRHAISGGSPLGSRLAAFYAGVGIRVYEGYGLTETTGAATVTPPHDPRPGTVGLPLPGTGVRIADDGEIWLCGRNVFAGYWNTGETQAPDHWFATGDIGALDEAGHLAITGRKKDLIITSGGKNVAPAPLEDAVRAHPLVGQCLVLGDRRPYVTALITLEPEGLAHWRWMRRKQDVPLPVLVHDPDLRADVQRAVDEANRLVSRAESIRRFALLPTEFTEVRGHLTPSLKLRRAAILRDHEAIVAGLYAERG
ncbi:AMP-dependent synthetase/ligase [Streptomyces sp. BI20]|uniref:AMP-dependent synthetase/ligase n=1 Tax=Streptomyces sp. BI20 TaxID=3403460 RepID=UPI003C723F84